jgi:hypothetical protein
VAAHAKDKLMERQEKLEVGYPLGISIRTHLVSGLDYCFTLDSFPRKSEEIRTIDL